MGGNPLSNIDPLGLIEQTQSIPTIPIFTIPVGSEQNKILSNGLTDALDALSDAMHSELPPFWPDHPDAIPLPDNPPASDADPAVSDPGGSGNSQRAKYCRGKCSKILERGGFTAEFDFRNCLRNCMQDPDVCI